LTGGTRIYTGGEQGEKGEKGDTGPAANMPNIGCRLYMTGDEIVPTQTLVSMLWMGKERDTDDMYDQQTERVYFKTAGIYLLVASICWESGFPLGTRYTDIQLNGNTKLELNEKQPIGRTGQQVVVLRYFNIGDYVEVRVWQTNGSNVKVKMANTFFSVQKIA